MLVIAGPGSGAIPSADGVGWFAVCLIAPVLYVMANVAASIFRPPSADAVALAAGILLGAAAGLLPLAIVTGQIAWRPTGLGDAEVATLLAALIYAAFTWLFLEIIRMAGPTFFAQFNYLAVLAGPVWGLNLFALPVAPAGGPGRGRLAPGGRVLLRAGPPPPSPPAPVTPPTLVS